MNQYYKATIKMQFEGKRGDIKFKKESYIVFAISPTDVETKLAKHLGVEDYEIVGINTTNIVDIVK
jgi:hypothetical protein